MSKISILSRSPEVVVAEPDSSSMRPAWQDENLSLLTFPSTGDRAGPERTLTPSGNCLKDATALADKMGTRIVVAERPFPAWRDVLGATDPRQVYNDMAARGGETLRRKLGDYLGDVALRGVRLGIYGESAAASYGLAVTRSRQLPIASIGAYDAVGLFPIDVFKGFGVYLWYLAREQPAFRRQHPMPDQTDIFEPAAYSPAPLKQLIGTAAVMWQQGNDVARNMRTWATSVTLENVRYVRDKMPNVGVLLAVPESSLAVHPSLTDRGEILDQMGGPLVSGSRAPYSVVEVPGFSHASVNDPAVHLAFARLVIGFAMHTSAQF